MKKLTFLILILVTCALFAEEPGYIPAYLLSYPQTGIETLTAPLSWETADWLTLAGVAGVLATAYLVDEQVKSIVTDDQNEVTDLLAGAGNQLGESYVLLPAIGTTLAGGLLLDSPKTVDTALLSLKSLILATGTTTVLKYATQRRRPDEDAGNGFWNGKGFSRDRDSFPSGHSTAVWSVATVIATQYSEEGWVPPLAYGLATLTCYGRLHADRHWLSDVIAGALIGYTSGKMTTSTTPRFQIYHDPGRSLIGMQYHF